MRISTGVKQCSSVGRTLQPCRTRVMPVVRAQASATHVAQLIDGKKIAEDIRKEIAAEVVLLKATTGASVTSC